MKTDVQIAQEAILEPISTIANKLHMDEESLIPYGKYKAKIEVNPELEPKGKLILVTAINPTAAGEGKTTTSIGLADAMNQLGKNAVLALREPSLGPVFGVKGGATGGGYAQVVPMEDINLHFTGDFSAVALATNLLVALLDNHIMQGNTLNIDPQTIAVKRVVDMNDRQLRHIVSGLNGKINGIPREDGFEIVVASEVMAILCLATDLMDLKKRLGNIIVAYDTDGNPIRAKQLKAEGAMCVLLKDAIKPNLVQTLEHTPAFIHGGPFANIAHGCNSIMATKEALKYGDYVVTEAGFGADLGAEKFLDIKCRYAQLQPSVVVVVATIRALKMHGGVSKDALINENIPALDQGIDHLIQHIQNIENVYHLNCVVALNAFPTDTPQELEHLRQSLQQKGICMQVSHVWEKGGKGGLELAQAVLSMCETTAPLQFAYELHESIEEKITAITQKIYHGNRVVFSKKALRKLQQVKRHGFESLAICMAKTQYSFSDDATLIGCPTDFDITVTDLKVCAGAGFIVVYCKDIMTMPGLPKSPAANEIDIDANGVITGLF